MAKKEAEVENIELTMVEQDIVYVSLEVLANSIESIEKKAKTLKAAKTEKAALSDASVIRELMNKFLTPARKEAVEEESEEKEESED